MHIIVAGGGMIGEQVARALSVGETTVSVVELDPTRAADLTARGLHVVSGSASSPRRLEAAGALRADVLVASTGRDEENLVIAALARRHFAIARVVATVRDEANRWLYDQSWGVDAAFSSATALVALIESATGSARALRLTELPDEGLVIMEVNVTDASRALGQPVASLSLGAGTLVAVVRAGAVLAPDPTLYLARGDRALIVTAPDGEPTVRDAFYDAEEASA
ncbi:MAG: potassium channel family protein [Acidimicrobiales bacterium]